MQHYDFNPALGYQAANTSKESVSIQAHPSKRVVRNIRNYARCIQLVRTPDVKIKLYLN